MVFVPTVDVDLRDPALVEDPYAELTRLRDTGPVVRQRSTGTLLVTSYAGVTSVLRDRSWGRVWSDRTPLDRLEPFNALHRSQMMENEPPAHSWSSLRVGPTVAIQMRQILTRHRGRDVRI